MSSDSWSSEIGKEVEYTEEIGLFFKNMIIAICKINENLQSIFGADIEISSEGLQRAMKIDPLFLGSGQTEDKKAKRSGGKK